MDHLCPCTPLFRSVGLQGGAGACGGSRDSVSFSIVCNDARNKNFRGPVRRGPQRGVSGHYMMTRTVWALTTVALMILPDLVRTCIWDPGGPPSSALPEPLATNPVPRATVRTACPRCIDSGLRTARRSEERRVG